MRYQDHIKTLQKAYFEHYQRLINAGTKARQAWEQVEAHYDYSFYSSYESFKVSLCKYRKSKKHQPA